MITYLDLYNHQKDAVCRSLHKLERERFALIDAGVGSGKSAMLTHVATKFKRVVILQPAMELVKQNYDEVVDCGLNITKIDSAHKGDWSADRIYTTPQTLHVNIDNLDEPDLLVIDEAHLFFSGKMFDTIFSRWQNCKVLALSGSCFYYDSKVVYKNGAMYSETTIRSIEERFGEAVIHLPRKTLFEMGYGCDIRIQRCNVPPCYDEHFKDVATYRPIIIEHLEKLKDLLENLENAIIYCDSRRHCELLERQFEIPTIYGGMPKGKREQIVSDFINGRIPFVSTVGCLKLGFNFPKLENIVVLTNYNNECETEQIIGRLNRGRGVKYVWHNSKLNTNDPVVGKKSVIKLKNLY